MLNIDLSHHFTKAEFDLADNMARPDTPISDINALLKLICADQLRLCTKTRRQGTDPLFHTCNRDSCTTEWAEYSSHMSDRLP